MKQREKAPKKKRDDTSSVSLSQAERQALGKYTQRFGGKMQKQVLTLLIRWFLDQNESVRLAVLGWSPTDLNGQLAIIFRALADELATKAGRSGEGKWTLLIDHGGHKIDEAESKNSQPPASDATAQNSK